MTPKLAEYIAVGKALDADERLDAAHQLLLSVGHDADCDRDAIEAAWVEVIRRRAEEVIRGRAHVVDGRAAHAQVRAEIAARRG